MSRNKPISDDLIAQELEEMFGIPDGMISEDDLEESDSEQGAEEDLVRVLTGDDVLLSSTAISSPSSSTCQSPSLPRLQSASRSTPAVPHQSPSASRLQSASRSAPLPPQQQSPSVARLQSDAAPIASPYPPDRIDGVSELSDFSSSDSDSDIDETDWKKQEWTQNPDLSYFDTPHIQSSKQLPNRTKPLTYFGLFFSDDVLQMIVDQTNLYASQVGNRNWTPTTVEEIKAFLGVLIQMGIHVLPSIEDYWSSDPVLQVPEIAETMTLKRFQHIMKHLHLNDNSQMPARDSDDYDKLYKIRPLLEKLNEKCQESAITTNSQSIDECMIKFKGRSSLKQYMPMKPVKRGYKVWVRADSSTGYVYMFRIYTGKTDTTETGLGSNVIKSLCEPLIRANYRGHFAFDNFFSSTDLLQYLFDHEIYSTATVRSDRQDLPLLVKKPKLTGDKEADSKTAEASKRQNARVKKMKRGKWKWRVKRNVAFAVWRDTKQVTVLSTAFHPKQRRTCSRTQKDGTKKAYNCPQMIPEYTKRMGGVDRFDQKRTPYAVGRKSKKWWKRIFYFLIDLAITNAYILYKSNSRVHNVMTQKYFRIALSKELINNLSFRKRSFHSMPKYNIKKSKQSNERQKTVHSVPDGLRTEQLGEHWPVEIETYKRCRLCSTKTNNKRSKIICERCEVPLCISPCFRQFHFD
ncbi:piggyBac transposable element-derived protein 4-like [Trichoplusia ni]|uniref:PiggyBac transposable element-derived protein 4-like n=1 Tax=Trichoplusia ni TaxID=7111 RepID=A0A7E5W5F3_TRINI|nr:piggyBac transposable element-derived protein 4-like [Trichoplusia ni]